MPRSYALVQAFSVWRWAISAALFLSPSQRQGSANASPWQVLICALFVATGGFAATAAEGAGLGCLAELMIASVGGCGAGILLAGFCGAAQPVKMTLQPSYKAPTAVARERCGSRVGWG